jgi:hypothetical protein
VDVQTRGPECAQTAAAYAQRAKKIRKQD